ncbi:magnesium transporter CorA family protein [Gordonia alkanivorans]|uniref:magnesium transporter CorA family protein n=1 Tax=Gordonia alkanivorans TaxID=84096 RepID=UPI00244C87D2|nr:magnesium transporter CorA family protein [Gordonia alkanivorans]MDH3013027.1 magnesium transporter CorA family protein [Gordonia alkanivorans]MDH3024227.1 magnesium transporter CorA family protein [Gordonia alkanivorans]MDJ0028466.1 magnesium transporter CorA family protein [Gordonia alkanivorans]
MTDSAEAGTERHANERVRGQLWRDGEAVDGFDIDAISDCLDTDDPDTLIWADLECPTHETLSRVAAELDLDPFAVEDTVAAAERVKTVMYSGHTFVMVYAIALHDGAAGETTSDDVAENASGTDFRASSDGRARMFDLHRISIFVKRNVLITVRPTPDFDMDEVVRRWSESGATQHGMGALVHGLLDVVVDGHFDAVQRLDDEIEDLEALLFDERVPGRELQRRTYDLRKDLVVLRRVVLPMREVIAGIQRRRLENHAPPELDPHFSDLYDHALRATEWTESLRDMITTVFETNLTLADARLNTVMKKLTAWAAIIAIPTAITGFYGQNVPYPGYLATSGFIMSISLIVVIVLGLYITFRRRDWL